MIFFVHIDQNKKITGPHDPKRKYNRADRYGMSQCKCDDDKCFYEICHVVIYIILQHSFCRVKTVAEEILPDKKKDGDGRDIEFNKGRPCLKEISIQVGKSYKKGRDHDG